MTIVGGRGVGLLLMTARNRNAATTSSKRWRGSPSEKSCSWSIVVITCFCCSLQWKKTNHQGFLSGKYIGIKGSRSEIALEIISGQATNTLTTTIASDFSFGKVVSRLNSSGHLNCIAAADCLGGEKCDVIDFLRFTCVHKIEIAQLVCACLKSHAYSSGDCEERVVKVVS